MSPEFIFVILACFKRKRIPIWEFIGTQKNWVENKVVSLNMCLCSMKWIVGIHDRIILSLMWISLDLKTVMLAFLAWLLTCCPWISHHCISLFATAKESFSKIEKLFDYLWPLSYNEALFLIRIISFIKHFAEVI